jgi:autotransporter-associated beta strand protein
MAGAGTLVLNNATSDWGGNLSISAGKVTTGASDLIPNTAVVAQSAGTFDLATNSANETVKSISGSAGTIALGATSTLTLDNPAGETATQTLNVPSGGKIVKNGSGALTLSGGSGNNNATTGFRGELVLNSGTIGVGTATMIGGASTPTATLTINGGKLSNPDGTTKTSTPPSSPT